MDKPQKLLLCREKNFKVAFPKKKEKTGRKSHECVNQFNYSYSKYLPKIVRDKRHLEVLLLKNDEDFLRLDRTFFFSSEILNRNLVS